MSTDDIYFQEISVPFDYPVAFTHDAFNPDSPLIADMIDRKKEQRVHRAIAYVDAGLAAASDNIVGRIRAYFDANPDRLELADDPIVIPGGRESKTNYDLIRDVMSTIGRLRLDRQSVVLAVGGGNMLDAVGLATSLVHRGLRLVRMPSTVLSQNDAGVGVKNGIDEHGQKNFIGTFAPPFAVIDDLDLIKTLEDKYWRAGIPEAVKVAVIKDAAFFDFLEKEADALRQRNQDSMEELIRRCAAIHLDHIRNSGDPFEFGSARPLDFGHWSAHRLEVVSNHEVDHGCAVAVGIALDSCYAARKGLISDDDRDRIIDALTKSGLAIWNDLLRLRDEEGKLDVLTGLSHFQEHLGGALTITLPDGIGARVEVNEMDTSLIEECIEQLFSVYESTGEPK